MSGFEQTDNNTESLMDDVHETDNPVLRESDNPHWNLGEKEEGLSKHGLKDDMDSVFKKVGMLKETDEKTESYKTDSDDDSEYSDSLEKAEDGTYYDKETGKQYDSVEAWKKAQETLAKRYESTADFYENKANSEWAKFKNSEANGESDDEKWDHYKKSQEYYNKAKELREKAKAIREKLGENDSKDVGDNKDADDNKDTDDNKDVDDKKNVDDNKDTGDNKDVNEKGSPIQNKIDGLKREQEVEEELKKKYSPEEGYEILSEVYLRDKDGKIVKDPETGEARRVDFVVIKDGKVVDSIEVTSKTADKTEQTAKENRIRENGGNYIKDKDGNLIEIPSTVQTKIERRD